MRRLIPTGFGCRALHLSYPRAGLTAAVHQGSAAHLPGEKPVGSKLNLSPDITDFAHVYILVEDENQNEGGRRCDKKCLMSKAFQPGT